MVLVPVLRKYGRHRDCRHSRPRRKMDFDVNYEQVVEQYARIYTATGRANKCGGSGAGGGGGGGNCCEIFVIWFAFTLILANTLAVVSSRTTHNDDTDAGGTTSALSNGDNNVSASASATAAAFTSSCPNCLISRSVIRKYALEEIKQRILLKLGFTNGKPNISNKLKHDDPALKPFIDKINDTNSQDDDDEFTKTMYLVAIAKPCTYDR